MKKTVSNKFLKRVLGMESLENRELLSVSPLGVDYPDFVQTADTAQKFHTEYGGLILEESWTTYHSVTFEYGFDTNDYYKLCVAEIGTKITGTIAQGTSVSVPSTDNEGIWTVTGLTADKTYYFEVWKSADNGLLDPFVKETDIEEIPIVTIPSTTDAKLIKRGYNSSGYINKSELELYLFDLPQGYIPSDISITGTYGVNGTEKNLDQNFNVSVSDGLAGEFFINIGDLNDGDKVIITQIKIDSDIELFSGREFNAASEPTAEIPHANVLCTLSGITSNAVTLTWTKPTQAQSNASGNPLVDVTLKYDKKNLTTDYKITIDDATENPKIYYSQGKTTLSVTDLNAETSSYSYKIEAKLTAKDSGNTLLKDSDGYTVLASGLFETEDLTFLADTMAVGQPTDVKTVPTDTNVKITWKPPVNYTGGYKVIITNKSYLSTGSFLVAAGAKTEAILTIGNNESLSGTNPNDLTLIKGDRYEVVILPITGNDKGENGLTSTPTNFLAQKIQTDLPVTIIPLAKPSAPDADFITITESVHQNDIREKIVTIKIAYGKSVYEVVDGYWIKLNSSVPPAAITTNPAAEGYTYITREQIQEGVDIIATDLSNVAARLYASNSAGYETTGTGYVSSITPSSSEAQLTVSSTASAATVTGTAKGNKITVTWTNNNAQIAASDSGYFAYRYNIFMSCSSNGTWVHVGSVENLDAKTSNSSLKLEVTDLKYGTDYYFAVLAECYNEQHWGRMAALTTSASVKTASLPSLASANIFSAKSIDYIEYSTGNTLYPYSYVNVYMENYYVPGTKLLPEQYYVVLRDANKAVIASEFCHPVGSLHLNLDFILSLKSKYTIEVYGIIGTTISTAKTTKTFTTEDYPAASVKLASGTKATLNSITITITSNYNNYHYLQYTDVVDAKGKPDWNTAVVEKLDTGSYRTYVLGSGTTKLEPNTQYYVRVITSDANVAINKIMGYWVHGDNNLQKDNWWEATHVVFSKELKVKTAAVPLATISKSGLSMNNQFDLTLKVVGQTMLAAKDADKFFDTDKPLNGASFGYMLIVSTDSKVDNVTGKLLGGTEIDLYPSDITITTLPVKNDNAVVNGQYTIECALTGNDGFGIFETMGLSAVNISSLKTLNFQLATFVSYGTGNGFISLTKPSKVTMPKWFV
jgi:hypothetical protein